MNRRYFLVFGLIVLALFVVALVMGPRVIQRQWINHRNVGIHQTYTLSDQVDDSLFVLGQDITLEQTSHVTGDAAFIGGSLRVDGRVDGDLTATGTTLTLDRNAVIGGDLILIGSSVTIDGRVDGDLTVSGARLILGPTAEINGSVGVCAEMLDDSRRQPSAIGLCGDTSNIAVMDALRALNGQPSGATLLTGGTGSVMPGIGLTLLLATLALSGLAALAVAVFPQQISHIEEAIRATPRSHLVTGLMVFLLVIGLSSGAIVLVAVLPVVGVLLLPLLFVGALVLLGLLLIGLVTLTIMLGEWLLYCAFKTEHPPLVAAAAGSAALSLLLFVPLFVPYGGFLSLVVVAFLSALAIGAALSTRVGTRPLRQRHFVQG